MTEFKQYQRICFVLGLLLLGVCSPFIFGALNAHKNPEMNSQEYNYETKTFEDVPCPIDIRIILALIYCLPTVLMWTLCPIAMLGGPEIFNRLMDTLFGGKR